MPLNIVLLFVGNILEGFLKGVFLCLLVYVCLCVSSRKIPCNLMQGSEVTLQIVHWHGGIFFANFAQNFLLLRRLICVNWLSVFLYFGTF